MAASRRVSVGERYARARPGEHPRAIGPRRSAKLGASLAGLSLVLAVGCRTPVPDLGGAQVFDLTHPFDASTIFWPTEQGFVLERGPAGTTEAGYYYAANRFSSAEHGGTHLDAPIHFGEGQRSVDAIPLEQLMGTAVVVDVSCACAADRDHRVDIADLADWERAYGEIPRGAIVLLNTGFARFWPDRLAYLGTDARGPDAVPQLHFPGLDAEAARWLVEARGIRAVGIDTASIDFGQSGLFEAHRVLAAANVPIFENLTGLRELPARGLQVIALPMKIADGTGAPLRIVAIAEPAGGPFPWSGWDAATCVADMAP